jgi:hypothetical protein
MRDRIDIDATARAVMLMVMDVPAGQHDNHGPR